MSLIDNYFLSFLYATTFCLALSLAILCFVSKKICFSEKMIRTLFGGSLLLCAIHLVYMYADSFSGDNLNSVVEYLLLTTDLVCLVCCIIFFAKYLLGTESNETKTAEVALAQYIREEEESETEEDEEEDSAEPLKSPSLDDMLFFQKVEALMVNEKLFCEQELSREDVATAIGTNRTYLARSIKNSTGKTFTEYITDLRTAYAAKLLTTTDEPLDLIGTLVGFRSKSSYYRAFSSAYGCTPTDYRKKSICRSIEK